jgi:hypothetical protein
MDFVHENNKDGVGVNRYTLEHNARGHQSWRRNRYDYKTPASLRRERARVFSQQELESFFTLKRKNVALNELVYGTKSTSGTRQKYEVYVEGRIIVECTCPDFFERRMPCKHMYMLRRLKRGKFKVMYPDSDGEEAYDNADSIKEENKGEDSSKKEDNISKDKENLEEQLETRTMDSFAGKERKQVQSEERNKISSIQDESHTVDMAANEEPQTYTVDSVNPENNNTKKDLALELALAEISRLRAALVESESARSTLEARVAFLSAVSAHNSIVTSGRDSATADISAEEMIRDKLEDDSREKSLLLSSDEEDNQDIREYRYAIAQYLNAANKKDHSSSGIDRDQKKRKLNNN